MYTSLNLALFHIASSLPPRALTFSEAPPEMDDEGRALPGLAVPSRSCATTGRRGSRGGQRTSDLVVTGVGESVLLEEPTCDHPMFVEGLKRSLPHSEGLSSPGDGPERHQGLQPCHAPEPDEPPQEPHSEEPQDCEAPCCHVRQPPLM